MFITAERIELLEPRVNRDIATALAEALERDMPTYGISDLLGRAHFMGQAAFETEGFSRFQENLNYSNATRIAAIWPRLAGRAAALVGNPTALGNAAYANRNGNGDEASGDGYAFRGRGMFQLTGRSNYAAASSALNEEFVGAPDLVALPDAAVLTSLWFWKMRGCGQAAEADDCDAVTRLINGPGMNGAFARRELVESAKRIFT